jgi:hypothetical protein
VTAPLEAGLPGQPPQSLAAPGGPLLRTWSGPLAQSPVTVLVRQSLPHGSIRATALHKVVLVTVSAQTP